MINGIKSGDRRAPRWGVEELGGKGKRKAGELDEVDGEGVGFLVLFKKKKKKSE